MARPLEKPGKRFLGDFKVFGVACLHIGFVQNVVPCAEAMLVPRPSIDEPLSRTSGP